LIVTDNCNWIDDIQSAKNIGKKLTFPRRDSPNNIDLKWRPFTKIFSSRIFIQEYF